MAISSNVSEFLQKIRQGVKPNMFKVSLNFPGTLKLTADDQDLTDLLCKSAALPASNLGVIEVLFRGRTVKIAGDRTFDTWTATFVNDQDMKIRGLFENWLNQINSHADNTAGLVAPSAVTGYMAQIKVDQLEKDAVALDTSANVVRGYTLHHAFPTSVSQIDLAYDSNDQVSEFTVEFQLSYWTADAASGVPAIA